MTSEPFFDDPELQSQFDALKQSRIDQPHNLAMAEFAGRQGWPYVGTHREEREAWRRGRNRGNVADLGGGPNG